MPSQLLFEGLLLAGSGGGSFADFYRQRVRYRQGCRLASKELRDAYVSWGAEIGATVESTRAMRRFMEANGHPASKSSSMFFRDALLGDFEDAPLAPRRLPIVDARPVREAVSVTVDDLDQIIAELQGMRRRLARLMPTAKGRGA